LKERKADRSGKKIFEGGHEEDQVVLKDTGGFLLRQGVNPPKFQTESAGILPLQLTEAINSGGADQAIWRAVHLLGVVKQFVHKGNKILLPGSVDIEKEEHGGEGEQDLRERRKVTRTAKIIK